MRLKQLTQEAIDDRFAAALRSSADASNRDGARALGLIEPLLKHPQLEDDPGVWQLAAAAYAEDGRSDGPVLVIAMRAARAEKPDSMRRAEVCPESPGTGSRIRRCSR